MRFPVSVLSAAILGLGLTATPALAAGSLTVSSTGGTITATGTGGVDELEIQPQAGKVTFQIFYSDGAITPGAGCVDDPDTTSASIICDAQPNLQMTLDGGNDYVRLIGQCFTAATISMGDGTNRYSGESTCAGGPVTVNGDAGQDSFIDSSASAIRHVFNGGRGDDSLSGGGGNDELHGNDGNDSLSGGAGNDTLAGEAGADTLLGNFGDDSYDGGDGDDKLGVNLGGDDDQGADDLNGGPGSDLLDLHGHKGGMAISLDNVRNDGAPGENDNIHADIESVVGTTSNDTYTGSPAPDTFNGDSGADVIHGGDGSDTLSGGGDGDQVFGDGGSDTLYGSSGDDIVDGGAGADSLFGDESGCSQQSCPGGNDQLRSRDGEIDQVNCGAGADVATVDTGDVTAQDGFQACESVDRTGAAPGGAGANQVPVTAAFKFATTSTLSRAKGFKLRVTCPAACSWTATLVLGAKTAKKAGLGRKSITIGTVKGTLLKAGDSRKTLKLTKRARTKLKRIKTVTATLKLAVKDPAGKTVRQQKTLKLRK